MEPGAVLSGVLAMGVTLVLVGGFAVYSYQNSSRSEQSITRVFVRDGATQVSFPVPPEPPEGPAVAESAPKFRFVFKS